MKYIVSLLLGLVSMNLLAAEPKVSSTKATVDEKPVGIEASLEPYGTLSWVGINGRSELGAGVSLVFPLSPQGLSLVSFGEGDHEAGRFIERLGAGLRYTAYLGKYVSFDGGFMGSYDLENPHLFIRLPMGANFNIIRTKNIDVYVRTQYAFDIGGNKTHGLREGTSTGRFFLGPVASLKF